MANNTLNTRLVICNDTTANWGTSEKVLLKGEYAIEFPESGEPKVKIGNGTDKFADLPYITNTPTEITNAINAAIKAASHSHSNKAILDAITASFTTTLKTNYDKAYTHSQSAHAPSNAQANIIETVKVNGSALTPTSKAVDVKVPTKVSELTNDKNYISSYKDTKYTLGTPSNATNGNATIDITDSDSKKQSVAIKGTGATSVTTDANGAIIVNSTNTVYTHPNSGVTAGTYKSVMVNAQGHVTAGTNPTTLAGYGITDAAAKSHKHANADITSLDASKITTGTIDIARLPAGALERCVVVADDTARFALTKDKVQLGDTVKVTGTEKMYFVIDETKLSSEDGYTVYTAGTATSVPWSGITGKPSTFTPSSHNQAISTITGLQAALDGKATSAQGAKADTAVQSVKIGTKEYKSGTIVTLPAYPTTLPASDVKAWAKAATKPTYTKAEVGLGNVDNTADANKSVKYATSSDTATKLSSSAGSATQPVYFSGGKPVACSYTLGKSVPSNAVFTDTNTWIAFKGATTSAAGTAGYVPAPSAGAANRYLRSDGTWQVPPDTNTTYSLGNAAYKTVKDITNIGSFGWSSVADGSAHVPTLNTLAFWNGAYNSSGNSNISYTAYGKMGTIVTKNAEDYASASHFHSQYYDAATTRTANTVLAAPNGSNGKASFRKLVAADIPSLTKSKISDFSHTHDDRYYTETEINTKLKNKILPQSTEPTSQSEGDYWLKTTTL